MRDRPIGEASTWQHEHCTTDKIHATLGIRTHDPKKRGAPNLAVDRAATAIGHIQIFRTYFYSIHISRPYIGHVAEMYRNALIV
jgi:hypothetical protein